MFRAAALGTLGVVAICAISVGGMRSEPLQNSEVSMLAAPTNKADRLQSIVPKNSQPAVGGTEIKYGPDQQMAPPAPANRTSQTTDFVPRHWHDPYDTKPKVQKRAAAVKRQNKRPSEKIEASIAKECRTDGLHPFLRKLKLSPDCNV